MSTLGNQKRFKAAVRRAHKGQSCSPTAGPHIKLSMRKQQHAWQNQSSELVIKVACQDTSECPFFYISVFICAIFLRGFTHVGQPSLLCQPEKAFEYSVWEACLLLPLKSTACDLGRVSTYGIPPFCWPVFSFIHFLSTSWGLKHLQFQSLLQSLLCQPEKAFEYSVWEACLLLAIKSTACDLGRVREHMAFLPLAGQCFLLFTSWGLKCLEFHVSVSYMIFLSLRHVFSFVSLPRDPSLPFSRSFSLHSSLSPKSGAALHLPHPLLINADGRIVTDEIQQCVMIH